MAAIVTESIRIYCDDRSHEPRVATVGHLRATPVMTIGPDSQPTMVYREDADEEMLIGDGLVASKGVHKYDAQIDDTGLRRRTVYECPLCGLSVSLRSETKDRLVAGLIAAGVQSVRLRDLAASLGRRER